MHGLQNLRRNAKEKVGKRNREVRLTAGEPKKIRRRRGTIDNIFVLKHVVHRERQREKKKMYSILCRLKGGI